MTINKIVLLDFCSERNRGDAAMQLGTINLVRKYFPSSSYSIISVFGANQSDIFEKEYDHTFDKNVFLGGIKPTFYPSENNQKSTWKFEILNAIFCLLSTYLIILIAIGTPISIVLKLTKAKYHNTLKAILSADLIIWNGRNFRPRRYLLLDVYRLYNLLFHPLLCIVLKKKIACIGVSLWKFKTSFSIFLLKKVFNNCIFISAREESSFREMLSLMNEKNKRKVVLLPDLSFAAFNFVPDSIQTNEKRNGNLIGVTLVDWKSDGRMARENYKIAMIQTIKKLIEKDKTIVFVPQVTKSWESSEGLYREILDALTDFQKNKVSIYQGKNTIFDLMNVYSTLDMLIATRMHSAIFSAIAGTPVIAIAYDYGSKWNILSGIGLDEFILPYATVTVDLLIEKMEMILESDKNFLTQINKKVFEHIQLVDKNISLIAKHL
jgi:polysaccharide pyruvyl transferase WcaK-like protein